MTGACRPLRENCVVGINANVERLQAVAASSVGVVTALTPYIGHTAASSIAKTALLSGRTIIDLVAEAGPMSRERVTKLVSPARLSALEPGTAAIPLVAPATAVAPSPDARGDAATC